MTSAHTATREQLLRAIETGEHLPDQFLPIGIHRVSATRYRALLCTGGHKFKGPNRDTIREALEDRRKLCEQTGVDFVIYGKQTHVKGERPVGWQNAAVFEDGTTTVPVIHNKTAPTAVSKTSKAGTGATVSGRFAGAATATVAAATAATTSANLVGNNVVEEVVYSRRKTQNSVEHKLSKQQRKTWTTTFNRNQVMSHPYNLFLTTEQTLEPIEAQIGAVAVGCELAPITMNLRMDGKEITDKFLWSVTSKDAAGLEVYLTGLLMEAGVRVTAEKVEEMKKIVEDQVAGFKQAVQWSKRPEVGEPTRVQLFLDKVKLSAYTEEQVAREFAQVYAAEHGMSDAGGILWDVIDQCVAARAKDALEAAAPQTANKTEVNEIAVEETTKRVTRNSSNKSR